MKFSAGLEPVLSRPQAIAVADQYSQLNRAQRTVTEDVLSTRDRIQGIQGFAGSGKTSTLVAIRTAAGQLKEAGGRRLPSSSLHNFKYL